MAAMDLVIIISNLPRKDISVVGLEQGRVALSGSDGTCLLVANGLARRGYDIACISPGTQLRSARFRALSDCPDASIIRKARRVLWWFKGDYETLRWLNAAGVRPYVRFGNPITYQQIRWLEQGRVSGIIMVSDNLRCPFYHTPAHRRLGRIYNPVNPFYLTAREDAPNRYENQRVVFTGHLSERKGAHRVLQMWPDVRRQLPNAHLTVVGSAKLYGDDWEVGDMGLAEPAFEENYVLPLITEFGSLETAGVTFAGLLPANAIIALCRQSAVGLVNFNWGGSLETFCVVAVEMLANKLPVLSFARGALPETIGRSGGAVLLRSPSLEAAAEQLASMLKDSDRLSRLGEVGYDYVARHYSLEHILDRWEMFLESSPDQFERLSGPWAGPTGMRYQMARIVRLLGIGGAYQAAIEKAKVVRSLLRSARRSLSS